jgi:hypothetical protein
MKTKNRTNQFLTLLLIAFLVILYAPAKAQPVKGTFLYTLSDFTGSIPYSWPRVVTDKERNEIYVLYQNTLRIFNEFGMEIYRFGDDLELGHIIDVAVDQKGDILLLAYKESKGGIVLCNYRGEPKSEIELKDFPPEFSGFAPNRMIYHDGNLYLASLMGLTVVVTDLKGSFKKGYDLFTLLELDEKDRGNVEIIGFSVDKEGNILLTIPVLFRAYVLSPDGKMNSFGKPGSAPGKFNIIAGIARDSKGNYIVIDKLKCAVMVFDKNFRLLTQFATRGYKPGYLIAPDDIAIDNGDRIYVTQVAKKGVSVFRLIYN